MKAYYLMVTLMFVGMIFIPRKGLYAQTTYSNQLLENYIDQYEYKKAKYYIDSLLKHKMQLASAEIKMYYLTKSSTIYGALVQFNKADSLAHEALLIQDKVQDKLMIAEAALAQAKASMMVGDFDKALKFANQVMAIAKPAHHFRLQRDCLRLFGHLSIQNSKFKQGLEYYAQAQSLSLHKLDSHTIQADELYLGTGYLYCAKTDSALIHLYRAAQKALSNRDSSVLGTAHAVMAACHQSQQNQLMWKQHLQYAANIAFAIQHPSLIYNSYSQLMEYEMAQENYPMAIKYGLNTKSSLQSNPMPLFEVYVDSLLFKAYHASGNLEKAIEHLWSFHQQQASILNSTQLEKINQLQHEFELREKNLELNNKQLALEVSEKKFWLLLSLNFILLAGIIGGIMTRWFRNRYRKRQYQKEKMLDTFLNRNKASVEAASMPDTVSVEVPDESSSYPDMEMLSEDHKALYEQMIQLIETKKLYLNPKLDAKLIITQLGTNRTYLYNAINNNAAINFRDIINRYRVEEAKKLIASECDQGNPGNNTLIYQSAGFNSASTYYRTFKQHTGLTPLEYAREYSLDSLLHKKGGAN
jgi:AraC-like DNA-binding protein